MHLRDKFTDFWPIFLAAHLSPWNRRLHALGNLTMLIGFVLFAVTGRWVFFAAAFAGYLPSWTGHLLFEGKAPPTLRVPVTSAFCDLKMIGLMLSGTLAAEIERLFGAQDAPPGSPMIVTPAEERAFQAQLRNRIRAGVAQHPFVDYWDIFLLKHQRPVNIWIHVGAMVYLYALVVAAILTRRPEILLLTPLAQISGLISHAVFERNHIDFEDAIFSTRAFGCLNRMMVTALTGTYWRDLARVQAEWRAWRAEQPPLKPE